MIKIGHQTFSALKWIFFLKKVIRKNLFGEKNFPSPQNSALGLRLCVYLCVPVCFVYPSVCLPVCLSSCASISLSVRLGLYLSVSVCSFQSVSLLVCLSVYCFLFQSILLSLAVCKRSVCI